MLEDGVETDCVDSSEDDGVYECQSIPNETVVAYATCPGKSHTPKYTCITHRHVCASPLSITVIIFMGLSEAADWSVSVTPFVDIIIWYLESKFPTLQLVYFLLVSHVDPG